MPSNQYRPLTKPPARSYLPNRNIVQSINRALSFLSGIYIVISLLSSLAPASLSYGLDKAVVCDPFKLPGFISQLPSGLSTYRTFDQSCPVPGLLPSLLALLPSSPYHAVSVPTIHSQSGANLKDRIGNKTVLLIGDSVDEAFVEHFCTLTGHIKETVDQRHPWGAAWTTVPKEHSNSASGSNLGDKALAHYCYLPEYDFLLTSVYHLGTDVADTFQGSPAWTSPTLFEHRVEDIFTRYIKDLSIAHPAAPSIPPPRTKSQPDLAILSSSFWDLARYAQEDTLQMRSLVDDVSEQRLLEWRGRSVDMLHSLESVWRDTRLAWRSLHAPGDTEMATVEWWTGAANKGNVSRIHSSMLCDSTDGRKGRGIWAASRRFPLHRPVLDL